MEQLSKRDHLKKKLHVCKTAATGWKTIVTSKTLTPLTLEEKCYGVKSCPLKEVSNDSDKELFGDIIHHNNLLKRKKFFDRLRFISE